MRLLWLCNMIPETVQHAMDGTAQGFSLRDLLCLDNVAMQRRHYPLLTVYTSLASNKE